MDNITSRKIEYILSGYQVSSEDFNEILDLMDAYKEQETKAENLPISGVRLSLPDNQEIEKESECLIAKYQKVNDTLGLGFRAGAKWMRDEIVNRNRSEA